ncbi:bifunctional diaminohydroxyphosphoribosylaminopyrimidine deaminase/5-amino-6-(5-phosphoribosylamino)uracil reductase RibD [Hydrogenovibrio thermophilus]|nr:bifunctional diaminohydroxyphosphoribosylaminopyrimidine deaminase/5-amino-6-(5-phosphoribosylamino)uracil reductase RibD [Hydrogenovibrio thermophilus]
MMDSPSNTFSDFDIQMMTRAMSLARQGEFSTKPNPAVGCVITKDNRIIAEGWHQRAGEPHAERVALAAAQESVEGATVYVTLEPCSHHGKTPPCADALVEAKVGRVVVAMEDPNPLVAGQGLARLGAAGIDVQSGLLEAEAEALNAGFAHAMRCNLPYVRLKMANSLDGHTAMANGESQWITGAAARHEVHRMRAKSGALVTGIGTVLADDPSMTVRLPEAELQTMNLSEAESHPIRVVLDAHLSMPVDAKMLSQPGRTILMTSRETAEDHPELVELLANAGAEIVAVEADGDKLDILSVLEYLYQEEQVFDVLVEAGAIVAGAFLQSGYVNELHVFMAPCLMGHEAKPMFFLPGLVEMSDKMPFQYQSVQTVGDDLHLVLKPVSGAATLATSF